jgi:hypothetical protein
VQPQSSLWGVPPAAATRRVAPAKIYALRLGALTVTAITLVLIYRVTSRLPWYVDGLLALAVALAWAYRFERRAR